MESRLETVQTDITNIQSKAHTVSNNTRMIPPMFESVRMDGVDIGNLKFRVAHLENKPKT